MNASAMEGSLESLVGQVADEFLRRQRAGEHPHVEEYLARYPEAADVPTRRARVPGVARFLSAGCSRRTG
jgi:hypothetical protein